LPELDTNLVVVVLGAPEFDIVADGVISEPYLGSLIEAANDVIDIVEIRGVLQKLCWPGLVKGKVGGEGRTYSGGKGGRRW
jgi:hypothetical protein